MAHLDRRATPQSSLPGLGNGMSPSIVDSLLQHAQELVTISETYNAAGNTFEAPDFAI